MIPVPDLSPGWVLIGLLVFVFVCWIGMAALDAAERTYQDDMNDDEWWKGPQ